MFKATTLILDDVPKKQGKADYSLDFFNAPANLTVSGQLSAEMLALALGDVYTFGPTFRAENSNTSRHVAEFWMVEPEMAFSDLKDTMDLSEEFLKYLTGHITDNCAEDVELFAKYVDKSLMRTIDNLLKSEFTRLSYKEAIGILNKSGQYFEYDVKFGKDLQSEHERYLTERYFKKPLIVYDYPKNVKPFYMRLNNDKKTVAAMDVLVPNIGEIIGGSQREERLTVLESRMDELGLSKKDYWWYIESRKYGSVVHSGFGLGFERLLMFLTGVTNIRDVIAFPRTPNSICF
jgi:asparaginyl-tRNA synthetase